MHPTANTAARVAAPIALAVVLLGAWEWFVRSGGVAEVFLPAPSALAERFWLECAEGPLLKHAGVTLIEALCGTGIAIAVALPLGYLVARVAWIRLTLTPYITASQAVPAVAVAPLLALWIGYGLTPVAILCAIVAFFPMLVTTTLGVRAVPTEVLEAARLDGANWAQTLVWVEGPLMLPSVLTGIRAGIALSVTGAVVGEFTMGGKGLGQLLTLFRDANDTEGLFATLVMLVALAIALFTAVYLLERLAGQRGRNAASRRMRASTMLVAAT
ncbi:ABC transporter permease [Gulosibacter bifidus]|uniref:ABC transporter permease n=1 Tax=Gulosibacter bifidus TaxID=272239 RepID=A0ABW5RJV4_9MICO|nr:ABC transporter permease [Gulosibacter bifidus]